MQEKEVEEEEEENEEEEELLPLLRSVVSQQRTTSNTENQTLPDSETQLQPCHNPIAIINTSHRSNYGVCYYVTGSPWQRGILLHSSYAC